MSRESPLTIAGFQAEIRARYYETDSARGAAGTFLWFAEEVGELASAIAREEGRAASQRGHDENLAEEFADVLAWLATLANVTGVDLEAALGKYTEPGGVEGVKE